MIEKIKVGGKFPTNLQFTSGIYEVDYVIPEGETLEEATSKCKLLVAKAVSGGDSKLFKVACEVLNYPRKTDQVEQLVQELAIVEADIVKLQYQIQERHELLADLMKGIGKLNELEALLNFFDCGANFWGLVFEITEKNDYSNHPLLGADENEGRDDFLNTYPTTEEEHF